MKGLLIGFAIFIVLCSISMICSKIIRPLVNLFDENIICVLKEKKYERLLVKRKKRNLNIRAMYMIKPAFEEFIEVYGIKKNMDYLLYETYWSEEDMENIKKRVIELNKKLIN